MVYDPEAIYQDADIEMAEMVAQGNAMARARRRGICFHDGSRPAPDGKGFVCTENTAGCQATFATRDDWLNAHQDALAHWA